MPSACTGMPMRAASPPVLADMQSAGERGFTGQHQLQAPLPAQPGQPGGQRRAVGPRVVAQYHPTQASGQARHCGKRVRQARAIGEKPKRGQCRPAALCLDRASPGDEFLVHDVVRSLIGRADRR